jgi:hypothetical protein
LYYPNRIGRTYLCILEDQLGRSAFQRLLGVADLTQWQTDLPPQDLRREFPFAHMSATEQALQTAVGPRRAHEIALACGRAIFVDCRSDFGWMQQVALVGLRCVSVAKRIRIITNLVAQTFDRFSDQPTYITRHADHVLYTVEQCPECWNRTATTPCCTVTLGLLEAAVEWATDGLRPLISEYTCRAMGDEEYTFHIPYPSQI